MRPHLDVEHFALENGAAVLLQLLSERLGEALGIRDEALLRQIDAAGIVACERRHEPLDAGGVNLIADYATIAPELPCERVIAIREFADVHDHVAGLPNKIGATRALCKRQMRIECLTEQPDQCISGALDLRKLSASDETPQPRQCGREIGPA